MKNPLASQVRRFKKICYLFYLITFSTALDVEAILNCELPPVVKTIPPSPNFPIPGSCDVNLTSSSKSSPVLESAPSNPVPVTNSPVNFAPEKETEPESEENEEKESEVSVKPNMFYTPDEEERGTDENAQGGFEEIDTVDYVPPFNNPVYPNDSNFTPYASVLGKLCDFVSLIYSIFQF